MSLTIDLDHQRGFMAIEIRDVRSERVLAAEPEAEELFAAELRPEQTLRERCFCAELGGALLCVGVRAQGWVGFAGIVAALPLRPLRGHLPRTRGREFRRVGVMRKAHSNPSSASSSVGSVKLHDP